MDIIPLIYKVLADSATEGERKQVRDWILVSAGNREEYNNIRLLWENRRDDDRNDPNHREGWEQVKKRIRRKAQKRTRRLRIATLSVLFAAITAALHLSPLHHPAPHLTFHDQPLKGVIKTLESEYDIRIKLRDNDLLHRKFTATFHQIDNATETVALVANALGIQYEIQARNRFMLYN